MREDRREELLGAALGDDPGDLTAAERDELDALLREDPTARPELVGAQEVVAVLAAVRAERESAPPWDVVEPPASLRERVRRATGAPDPHTPAALRLVTSPRHDGEPERQPRGGAGRAMVAAGAAVLLGAGVAGGVGLERWLDRPGTGAPGTLGAQEAVTFADVPAGVDVTASVVAHTWGTETVFEQISGLSPGATYQVVLVADDGTDVGTGSFEAVAGPVNCRMTSATMREDVRAISVRTAGGAEVTSAQLPDV